MLSAKAVYRGMIFSETSVSSGVESASTRAMSTDITRSRVGLRQLNGSMVFSKVGASGLAMMESILALASAIPASNAGM